MLLPIKILKRGNGAALNFVMILQKAKKAQQQGGRGRINKVRALTVLADCTAHVYYGWPDLVRVRQPSNQAMRAAI